MSERENGAPKVEFGQALFCAALETGFEARDTTMVET
jgi:hypothetical protein